MPEKENRDSRLPPLTVNGREVPLRWIVTILAFLGLGTGGTSIFMSRADVDDRIEEKQEPIKKRVKKNKEIDDSRHVTIDDTFKKVVDKMDQLQNVQFKSFARDEAVRIVDEAKIKKQGDREAAQFRLYDMNLSRLKHGRETCQNIDCTN